jgi:hypothetical protein
MKKSSSFLCMAFGFLLAAVGLVALIWMQVDTPFGDRSPLGSNAWYRWQLAIGPLTVIGIGVLIAVAGLIVGELQTRRQVFED